MRQIVTENPGRLSGNQSFIFEPARIRKVLNTLVALTGDKNVAVRT